MGFLRRFSNPLKINWERSAPSTGDLRPKIKDAVFTYQTTGNDFVRIDAGTLLVAEICGTQAFAEKVIRACEKISILDPLTGYPNTNKIDRHMVAQMPHISMPKQKELIMLLFFQEAEIYRYRLLCVEELELLETMARDGLSDLERVELLDRLRDVEAQKKILPSWRMDGAKSARMSMNSGSSTVSTFLSYDQEEEKKRPGTMSTMTKE